jgi:hypothetical protein
VGVSGAIGAMVMGDVCAGVKHASGVIMKGGAWRRRAAQGATMAAPFAVLARTRWPLRRRPRNAAWKAASVMNLHGSKSVFRVNVGRDDVVLWRGVYSMLVVCSGVGGVRRKASSRQAWQEEAAERQTEKRHIGRLRRQEACSVPELWMICHCWAMALSIGVRGLAGYGEGMSTAPRGGDDEWAVKAYGVAVAAAAGAVASSAGRHDGQGDVCRQRRRPLNISVVSCDGERFHVSSYRDRIALS